MSHVSLAHSAINTTWKHPFRDEELTKNEEEDRQNFKRSFNDKGTHIGRVSSNNPLTSPRVISKAITDAAANGEGTNEKKWSRDEIASNIFELGSKQANQDDYGRRFKEVETQALLGATRRNLNGKHIDNINNFREKAGLLQYPKVNATHFQTNVGGADKEEYFGQKGKNVRMLKVDKLDSGMRNQVKQKVKSIVGPEMMGKGSNSTVHGYTVNTWNNILNKDHLIVPANADNLTEVGHKANILPKNEFIPDHLDVYYYDVLNGKHPLRVHPDCTVIDFT